MYGAKLRKIEEKPAPSKSSPVGETFFKKYIFLSPPYRGGFGWG